MKAGEENCLFCKIIAGEIHAEKIFEDDWVLGFLDIRPVNPGHILVVPKQHSKNIYDVPEAILQNMIAAAKKISHTLKRAVGAEGVSIHMNNEPVAGQVVFHAHIHVIPRFSNDGFTLWHGNDATTMELKKVGEKVRGAMEVR